MKTVIYDKVPGKDYEYLHTVLKSLGGALAQYSCWLVPTHSSSLDTLNHLRATGAVDRDDRVLVINLESPGDIVWQHMMSPGVGTLQAGGFHIVPLQEVA